MMKEQELEIPQQPPIAKSPEVDVNPPEIIAPKSFLRLYDAIDKLPIDKLPIDNLPIEKYVNPQGARTILRRLNKNIGVLQEGFNYKVGRNTLSILETLWELPVSRRKDRVTQKPYNVILHEFLCNFTEDNMELMQNVVDNPERNKDIGRAFDLVCRLSEYPGRQIKAVDFLLKNFDKFVEQVAHGNTSFNIHNVFVGDEMQSKNAKDKIVIFLERYGLNANKMLHAWSESMSKINDNDQAIAISRNFSEICRLESQRPGIARILNKEFGIVDFDRYPTEMLISQFDNIDNKVQPYGIIIFPIEDDEGSFYMDRVIFEHLFNQLKDLGCLIRVIEAGSRVNIARSLISLDRRYGDTKKISFAIIGAHGSADRSFIFLGSGERGTLSLFDLGGKGGEKIPSFFVHNPTIILASCYTGNPEGLGQEISRMGAEVIAAKNFTALRGIDVCMGEDSRLNFSVRYLREEDRATYDGGELKE